jgi:hypothetical protein
MNKDWFLNSNWNSHPFVTKAHDEIVEIVKEANGGVELMIDYDLRQVLMALAELSYKLGKEESNV